MVHLQGLYTGDAVDTRSSVSNPSPQRDANEDENDLLWNVHSENGNYLIGGCARWFLVDSGAFCTEMEMVTEEVNCKHSDIIRVRPTNINIIVSNLIDWLTH